MKGWALRWRVRIISVAVVVAAWQVLGSLNPSLLSTPLQIVNGFGTLFTTSVPSGIEQLRFTNELAFTLGVFAMGFVVGTVTGIVIGAAMSRWRTVETALDPYVTALYNMPYIALAPLFMILFGVGVPAYTIVVFLAVVFVVIINALAGFKYGGKELVETARSFGSSGVSLYSKVALPAALPYITTGMRLGLLRGITGVIVAESVVQIVSLGYMIQYYYEATLQLNVELAIVVTLAVIGLVLTEILKFTESSLSRWRQTVGTV